MRVKVLIPIALLLPLALYAKKKPALKLNPKKSKVTFYVDAKLENVTGVFNKFKIEDLTIRKNDFESLRGRLLIRVDSVTTGKRKRDKHLAEDDFFHAKKYPNIMVEVLEVSHDDEDDYEVMANISIKGITRKFHIPVEIVKKKKAIVAKGKFYINRKHFGVNGNIISNAVVDNNAIARFTLWLER